MARIRTIKPEFFRHEGLQDLSAKHGAEVMLVFAGLWGHCDKAGRFEWKPRTLKLDILPFLDFDMADTLDILWRTGFVHRYEVDGREYGEIASFEKHQRIGGKEAQEPAKHPEPTEYKQGSNWEATGKQSGLQEGKGREGKGKEGNGGGGSFPPASQEAPASPKKPATKATQLPADFYPNETGISYAEQRGIPLAVELESFRNWHSAKGSTMKDWQAAWRTWCDKAVEFGRAGKPGQQRQAFKTVGQERAETIAYLTGKTPAPVVELPAQGQLIEGEASRVA